MRIISRCSLKSSLESKTIPRCFWDSVKLTVLWLKMKHGWLVFSSFRPNITSCACLIGSGLNFVFHENAQVSHWLILSYFLQQRIDIYHLQIILQWILNHQISCLCILEKKNGPNLGPCGAPASVATHEEYCPFRTTLCFRLM